MRGWGVLDLPLYNVISECFLVRRRSLRYGSPQRSVWRGLAGVIPLSFATFLFSRGLLRTGWKLNWRIFISSLMIEYVICSLFIINRIRVTQKMALNIVLLRSLPLIAWWPLILVTVCQLTLVPRRTTSLESLHLVPSWGLDTELSQFLFVPSGSVSWRLLASV